MSLLGIVQNLRQRLSLPTAHSNLEHLSPLVWAAVEEEHQCELFGGLVRHGHQLLHAANTARGKSDDARGKGACDSAAVDGAEGGYGGESWNDVWGS